MVPFTIFLILVNIVVAAPPLGSLFTWQTAQDRHSKLQPAQHEATQKRGRPLGAVASESAICTNIGTDLISAGGSAADAVVGTVLCVGVVGMYHSGIGGGGFMIVRAANGTAYDIDFRESAPAAATEHMYDRNASSSIVGGLSVGVPGELRGLQWLHNHFGKLSWKDVVMPSVRVARQGWTVGEDLVRYMAYSTLFGGDFLAKDPNWALDFAPTGKLVELGDRITRRRYADALQMIAEQGVEVFYSGPMAKAMVKAVADTDGIMTLEDLADYKIVIRKPLSVTYRNFRLTSCGAPASGAVALGVMKILEGYEDFGSSEMTDLNTHRLNEAFRFGYGMVSISTGHFSTNDAQRGKMGDPPFVPGIEAYQFDMINETLAAEIRFKISDTQTFNESYYNPDNLTLPTSEGTAQISVTDATGLTISITSTINLLFGSRVMDPETGIILNDEMNDFSISHTKNAFNYTPMVNNHVASLKRPLSSITPVIVEHLSNGSVYFITGAAGGSRIPSATIQSLWHVLDRNTSVYEALSAPRLHDQLSPNLTELQTGFSQSTADFLASRGHIIRWVDRGMTAVHSIKAVGGDIGYEAVGEPHQKNSLGKVAYGK
jgi:gamma-glutamyltranspeptidase / glutathione hydrolase